MCGIVGFWNLDGQPATQESLIRFTDALAHRGPDGNGTYIDEKAHLGLGHRRLAIIDTSDGGRQPMSFGNGRYWITYNGEIYNFLELKSELLQEGYQFTTDSDTEIILASFDCWGEECQLRLNGMWAFAIWDRRDRRLFVSRDRFGVKPLIYYFDGRRFAFASEMKAFLALDWFHPEFEPEMVAAALLDNEVVEGTERCILRGLQHLLGGHSLSLTANSKPEIRRWWRTLDHLEIIPQRYEDQVGRFRELFLDACRIRMRSDVPIGTALSGGLDSSSILCGMRHVRDVDQGVERLAGDWQKAFIVTYPGAIIDERKYADEVIRHTGVTPIYCTGTSGMYLDHFDDILFHYEELSDIHLGPWLVHKAQRENGVVVTIDGHGGDEALGGYPWYISAALKSAITSFSPRRAFELMNTLEKMEPYPDGQFHLHLARTLILKAMNRLQGGKQSWLLQEAARFVSPPYEEDRRLLRGRDALFKQLYIDFHFTQLPTNLRDFDRLSMAHGVEVRSPFMDWRLVSFLFSLPSDGKIGHGFTKLILRDAMKGILPEKIRTRTRKLGFPNLAEAWSSARGRQFIYDSVSSTEFQQSGIWDGKYVADGLLTNTGDPADEKLYQAWKLIQAMSLIRLFQEKRRLYK